MLPRPCHHAQVSSEYVTVLPERPCLARMQARRISPGGVTWPGSLVSSLLPPALPPSFPFFFINYGTVKVTVFLWHTVP